MRLRRTLACAAAAAWIGVLAAAGSAQAITFNPGASLDPSQVEDLRCSGHFCVFEHAAYRKPNGRWSFGSRFVSYRFGSEDMSLYGPYFNDMTSGVWNDTGSNWCVYEHARYRGRAALVPRYSFSPYVGNDWNDIISSARQAHGAHNRLC